MRGVGSSNLPVPTIQSLDPSLRSGFRQRAHASLTPGNGSSSKSVRPDRDHPSHSSGFSELSSLRVRGGVLCVRGEQPTFCEQDGNVATGPETHTMKAQTNRRDFLKTSAGLMATAGVGAAALGDTQAEAPAAGVGAGKCGAKSCGAFSGICPASTAQLRRGG